MHDRYEELSADQDNHDMLDTTSYLQLKSKLKSKLPTGPLQDSLPEAAAPERWYAAPIR